MPLNRCVAWLAPASTAAEVTSAVASVWPTAAMTPASTAALIRAVAPGSSGARVMTRSCPAAAACRRSKAATSGAVIYRGSWAPHLAAARNGPSRWRPASTPSRASPASIAARASRSARGAVTRLATIVVLPCRRWNSAARLASPAVPSVNDVPPPPCTCMSTKPGSTHRPCRSVAGSPDGSGPAGPPGPIASITLPASRIQPGLSTPSGVTTRPPVSRWPRLTPACGGTARITPG